MHEECHRCGADLDAGSDGFCCPQCGSPQLHMTPNLSEVAALTLETTGEAPPPKAADVNWNAALRSSLLVSAVGAALFTVASYVPAVTIVSLLWTISAASISIALYRQREPLLRMDGAIGARIGLSVGVLMAASLAVALTAVGLMARFRFHSMAAFDAEMTERMQAEVAKAIAANPAPANIVQGMLSQEFRTGIMLSGLLLFSIMILLLSTIGGLLSGMVVVGRRRTA